MEIGYTVSGSVGVARGVQTANGEWVSELRGLVRRDGERFKDRAMFGGRELCRERREGVGR